MSLRTLHIAAVGWEHPGWAETFYPDDLPPEWRLEYYANEFRAVVLPAPQWRACTPQMLAAWAAESPAEFRFFLRAETTDAPQVLGPLAAALGDRFGGTLIDVGMPGTDASPLLQAAAAAGPVGQLLAQAPSQAPSVGAACWELDGLPDCRGEGLVAFRWPAERGREPRALRSVIEALARTPGSGEALLLFEGAPPDLEAMRTASVIAELLGL